MKNGGSNGIANKIYWKGITGYKPERLILL
jgi:hypothetical protein